MNRICLQHWPLHHKSVLRQFKTHTPVSRPSKKRQLSLTSSWEQSKQVAEAIKSVGVSRKLRRRSPLNQEPSKFLHPVNRKTRFLANVCEPRKTTGQTTSNQTSIKLRSTPKRRQTNLVAPRYLESATPRSLKRAESSVKAMLKVKKHIMRSKIRKGLLFSRMLSNQSLS